jgi:hypothetical protein
MTGFKLGDVGILSSTLLSGSALEPEPTDLIALTGQLAVGRPVPSGWNVMTGNQYSSLVAAVAYRQEVEQEVAAKEEQDQ